MTRNKKARVWIGTSGWHYKHWVGTFYPERTRADMMLAYYLERFDTVELNNSFYQLPKPEALAAWRDATPENFCFSAKGSRFLTHMKKLKDAEAGMARFLERIETLQHKLAPILFQLPPQWERNEERLASFLKILPTYHRYAFEFRNQTWFTPGISQLLANYQAAHCVYHLAGYQSALDITTDFTYVRLHGPGGKYQGSYDDASLAEWAGRIRTWGKELQAVYVYFDKDESGYAAKNAQRLKDLLAG